MAIRHYSQALSLEPAEGCVWYLIHNNLGYCLNHFGRFDEAEFYCRKAIEIDPARQNAYKNLGIALEGQEDYAGAAMCYIRAVHTNASDARSLRHLESLADKHPVVCVDVPDFDRHLQGCRYAVAQATQRCNEILEQQEKDASPVSTDKRPARILCLDDEPGPLGAYKCILEPLGYEVLTTRSSTEALRIMRTETVDLLIQDLSRPDINGIELYGIMKSDERLQHIPVVVCSGYDVNRKRFRELYPEVAPVIEKPYEIDHLLEVVRKALRSAGDESGDVTRPD
jgi:CheY-like chemotaxis protein